MYWSYVLRYKLFLIQPQNSETLSCTALSMMSTLSTVNDTCYKNIVALSFLKHKLHVSTLLKRGWAKLKRDRMFVPPLWLYSWISVCQLSLTQLFWNRGLDTQSVSTQPCLRYKALSFTRLLNTYFLYTHCTRRQMWN